MAEPPIRCKFFNPDGTPIDEGCYRPRCRFIHPSHQDWNDAVPHTGRRTSGRSRDESKRGHTKRYGPDNPWSKAPKNSDRRPSRASTNHTNKYTEDQLRSVGAWSLTNTPEAKDTPVKGSTGGSGWADKPKDASWGSGELSNQWGEGSSAWGSSGWGGASNQSREDVSGRRSGSWGEETSNLWGKDVSGWGSSGWGEDKTLQSNVVETGAVLQTNQAAPNSPSILSTSPAISRLQRSSDQLESLSKNSPSNKSSSDAVSLVTTAISKLPQDIEMKETASPTPPSGPVSTAKRARLPLPTRMKQTTRDMAGDPLLPPSPAVPQDWGMVSLSGSISSRVQSDDAASEASTSASVLVSLDPKELHSRLIKNITYAVFIRYGLLKAEERKEKWRNARGSTCYHHSTPAAQKTLESTNHQLSEEIAGLNKQLKVLLREIIKCSDALSMHKGLLEQRSDHQKVLRYTDELRGWLGELDLHKRLMFIKMTIEQERKERETRNCKQGEVNELKGTIYELELQIMDISDDLHSLQDSLPDVFREQYLATEKILRKRDRPADLLDLEGKFTELGLGRDVFGEAEKKIVDIDLKALSQPSRADELGEHIKALEEEVKDLKQKEQQIIEFRQQASDTMKKMEEWKKEDKARLDKISQEIEFLHTQSTPHPPFPHPIKIEDLAPHVDELVIEYIANEIKPTLIAINDAVDADSQQFTAGFNRLVEQIVMKTYDLIQMALRANGFVPHFVPSPT